MFGRTRKRRFEEAVLEEVAYMLALYGPTAKAVEAARARAGRSHLNSSRVRVLDEAVSRLETQIAHPRRKGGGREHSGAGPKEGLTS